MNERVMEQSVDRVQLKFRAGHLSKWSWMCVVGPISVRSNHNDLVSEPGAAAEISFPILRNENLKNWNCAESAGRATIAEQAF